MTKCILLMTISILSFCNADWWESGNFYQIYPRSFKDSGDDGIGDLKGITSKLDYLKELGMTGVWLSPIFKSPMADFGYDISDYYQIHGEYGTVDDFVALANRAKELEIKLILDFVPNHTSDEHEWFQKSVLKDPLYDDFYVWAPGRIDPITNETLPPTNWVSNFRYSAWEYHPVRKEYYLHQFAIKQPDLNYRNPYVVEEMKKVLRFWLDKGVDGFRIDAVPFLFETMLPNKTYPSEPLSGLCDDPNSWCYLTHIHTQDHDLTYDMIYQWRNVLDTYKNQHGGDTRIMMTEAYTSLPNIIRFYGDETHDGSHIPFNFELMTLNRNSTGKRYIEVVNNWLYAMPTGKVANWVMGNHDQKRLASRFGEERIDLLNIFLQTLPGIAVTYNGEELGMIDVWISWADTVDPAACNMDPETYLDVSRDPARTPFQWNDEVNAGFSTATKTWLPVSPDYKERNVKLQEGNSISHLNIFKDLVKLRQKKSFTEGDFNRLYTPNNEEVLLYTRSAPGDDTYLIVLNLGEETAHINAVRLFPTLPSLLNVVITSNHSNYVVDEIVNAADIVLGSNVGVIFLAFQYNI